MQVSTSGGETAPLPISLASADVYDFFPGRSELLVKGSAEGSETEWPVWILPLPAGSLRPWETSSRTRRLGLPAANASCTLPNQGYTFATPMVPIRMNSCTVTGIPFAPRFSPDGRRLRFTIRDPDQRTSSLWKFHRTEKVCTPVLPEWNKPAQEFGGLGLRTENTSYSNPLATIRKTSGPFARVRTGCANGFANPTRNPRRDGGAVVVQ